MPTLLKSALVLLSSVFFNSIANASLVIDDTPWPSHPTAGQYSIPALSLDSASAPVESRPIFIFAFVHDDVPESKINSIFPDYFLPMIKEIKAFSGRRVSVEFIRNTPPYTNFAYKGENKTSYNRWVDLAYAYRSSNNLPDNRTTKFILLTNDKINANTLGLASAGQFAAIASLPSFGSVAHEMGHLLDGNHESAEIKYNGWWCETFLYFEREPLRSNCYTYTDANKARMNAYLSEAP